MRDIRHIGIIPDGNRRWAKANQMDLSDALSISMYNLYRIVESALLVADEVSVYMLSKENLKREPVELDVVLKAEDKFIHNRVRELSARYSVRVVHAGAKECLPAYLVRTLDQICSETMAIEKKRINLLLAYNPLDEIACACRKTGGDIGIKDLWVSSEVDMVIRTGGGRVISSNFLPLQCAYSSCYMVDVYFNDFTVEHFMEIYNEELALNRKKGL